MMTFLSLGSCGTTNSGLEQKYFSSIFLCQGPGSCPGELTMDTWDSVAGIASCLGGAIGQQDRSVTNGSQKARDLDTYCLPPSLPLDSACVCESAFSFDYS